MSLPSVYFESTIPSYLVAKASRDHVLRGQQEATRRWWDEKRAEFSCHVSAFVEIEIVRGHPDAAEKRLKSIAGIPRVGKLTGGYASRGANPRFRTDSHSKPQWTRRISRSPLFTAWNCYSHGIAHTFTTCLFTGGFPASALWKAMNVPRFAHRSIFCNDRPMKINPILKEIRQTRDQLSEESAMNLRHLFAAVRKQERAAVARGETLLSNPSQAVVVRAGSK